MSKKTIKNLIKEHKKEITFVAVGVAFVACSIILYKKRDSITKLCSLHKDMQSLKSGFLTEPSVLNNIPPITNSIPRETIHVNVPEYIRNLPKGQKASPAKKMYAELNNISLEEGKTLVGPYDYNRVVA